MNINEAIKEMITAENMPTSLLMDKMGYSSRSAINRILDNGNPTVATLIDLCEALNFEVQLVSKKKYDTEDGTQKKKVLSVTEARKRAPRQA